MTNNEAIGILGLVVETAKGRCLVTDEAISEAFNMAIAALTAQGQLANNSPKVDSDSGDLIDRQAVINVLDRNRILGQGLLNDTLDHIADAIMTLPSTQPEIIRCGECKYMMEDGRCYEFADDNIRPSASDFCSYAERRTDEANRC